MSMDYKNRKREKGTSANFLKPRTALIVTPSSTKAMDVSGGVAKVLSNKICNYMITYLNINMYENCNLALIIFFRLMRYLPIN